MIHERVPHGKELLGRERLSEEIRQVARRGHERDHQVQVLDAFPYEEVPPLNVLHAAAIMQSTGFRPEFQPLETRNVAR